MANRNVTLSLPDDLLRDAKVIAARKHTSVSAILSELLADFVAAESGANRAHAMFEEVASGLRLGTGGTAPVRRDELHAR